MSHGLQDVTLQSSLHKLIMYGLQEVTSERQAILHDPSVMSMVLMVQNGQKCVTYIYCIIKQLLINVSVDMECYRIVNLIILTSTPPWSI